MMVEAFPPPSFVRCRSLPLSFFPLPPSPGLFSHFFPPPLPSPAEEGGPGGEEAGRRRKGGRGERADRQAGKKGRERREPR